MSWHFDEIDDHVILGDGPALTLPSGPWAIGGWARPDNTSGSAFKWIISWGGNAGATNSFNLYIDESPDDTCNWQVDVGGVDSGVHWSNPSGGAMTVGWHHVLLQREGDEVIRLYIDGALQDRTGSAAGMGALNEGDNLIIGRDTDDSPNNFFGGDLEAWGKWGRALSAQEISSLAGGKYPTDVPGLAWFLPMETGGPGGDYTETIAGLSVTNQGTTDGTFPAPLQAPGGITVSGQGISLALGSVAVQPVALAGQVLALTLGNPQAVISGEQVIAFPSGQALGLELSSPPVAGRLGYNNSWSFNERDQYVELAHHPALALGAEWAIGGWLWPNHRITHDPIEGQTFIGGYIFSWGAPEGTAAGLHLWANETQGGLPWLLSSPDLENSILTFNTETRADRWIHFILQRQGNELQAHYDDVLWTSFDVTGLGALDIEAPIFFGARSDLHPDCFYPGLLQAWGKWNRSLSSDEITALFHGEHPGQVPGLDWFVPMVGGQASDVYEDIHHIPVVRHGGSIGQPAPVNPPGPPGLSVNWTIEFEAA